MPKSNLGSRKLGISALAVILALAMPASACAQPGVPPATVRTFLHSLIGEWIGTCEQTTNGKQAGNKYFRATIKESGPDTYDSVFHYYRLDLQTGVPVNAGVSTMTTTISSDGTAANRIAGKGDVLIDPKTSKPEQHALSEHLSMSPSGDLLGIGGGKIRVSGLPMGLGKNGNVTDYLSTWSLSNGILTVTQQINVRFSVLIFSKTFKIMADLTAKPGSNVAGLMKAAGRPAAASASRSARVRGRPAPNGHFQSVR